MTDVISTIDHVGKTHVFPIAFPDGAGTFGLTKRELFAAMMAQGIRSDSESTGVKEKIVSEAVELADALLKELAK